MGGAGLVVRGVGFTYTCGSQDLLWPNFSVKVQFFWAEKSLFLDYENCAENEPPTCICIFANTLQATGAVKLNLASHKKSLEGTFTGRKNKNKNLTALAPLNAANVTNWVLKRQILRKVFPLSHVVTLQTRTQTGPRLQLGAKAGGWRKKNRAEQANINSTLLYISICSTNVLCKGK